MKRFSLTIIALAIVLNVHAQPASADPMAASDVKGFFAQGPFSATAGSKFGFSSDGSFTIKHSNGSETGTYQIGADGTVTRMRQGASKPDVFYIDVNAKGKKSIVYTAGQYKGKKFPLK